MKTNSPKTNRKIWLGAAIGFALILLAASPHTALAQQWTTNGNNISNANTGNVGVGTSTPTFKFDVLSGTNMIARFGSTAAAHSQLLINAPSGYNSNLTLQNGGVSKWFLGNRAANNRFSFIESTGLIEVFSILQNGNVGIGTITPGTYQGGSTSSGTVLQLLNSANHAQLTLSAAGAGKLPVINLENSDATVGKRAMQSYYDGANNSFKIRFNNESTGAAGPDLFTLQNTGNVGIGTTTPPTKLSLQPAAFSSAVDGIEFTSSDNTTHSIIQPIKIAAGAMNLYLGSNSYIDTTGNFARFNASAANASISVRSSDGTIRFNTNTSGGNVSERMQIDSAGNVGIGSPSPGYRLDVQGGQVNASGGLCIGGDCKTAWSQVGGSQWTTSGSNIYYNSGNVGVGTTTPGAKLAVVANTAAVTATVAITPDGTNNYYAGNNHDALFVDGSLMGPHGNYTSAIVRLLRLRAQTGLDVVTVGRTGDVLVSPETRFAPYSLKLGPDASNSYYAGSDYDILLINGTGLSAHGAYTGKTLRPLRVTNASGGDAFVIGRDGNATFGGNVTVTGNIAAKYQDVAEWVESSQALAAGAVVVLDQTKSNQVVASSQAYDTRVAGVISAQPGIALGESGDGKVLVATTGRVRVKVDATSGPIHVGDLLVTSNNPGVAMKSEPIDVGGVHIHRPGTLIGKALEPLEKGTGTILVLLSLQ